MHILLLVLKITGLVLLGILGFVLLLLILVLFFPVRYKAEVTYHEEPLVKARVGWLGIIAFKLKFENKELWYRLSILGIGLKEKGKGKENARGSEKDHKKPGRKREKKKKRDRGEDEVKSGVPEAENGREPKTPEVDRGFDDIEKGYDETEREQDGTNREDTGPGGKRFENKEEVIGVGTPAEEERAGRFLNIIRKIKAVIKSVTEKIRAAISKIKSTFDITTKKIAGLWNKFKGICHKIKKVYEFITLKQNQDSFRYILKIGTRVLKHIGPRKIKGYVRFGLKDPCSTGKLLGVLSAFYGFYGRNISLQPEFEEACLEGELFLRGHMQIGVILFHALKIYFSNELKALKHNYQQLKEEL